MDDPHPELWSDYKEGDNEEKLLGQIRERIYQTEQPDDYYYDSISDSISDFSDSEIYMNKGVESVDNYNYSLPEEDKSIYLFPNFRELSNEEISTSGYNKKFGNPKTAENLIVDDDGNIRGENTGYLVVRRDANGPVFLNPEVSFSDKIYMKIENFFNETTPKKIRENIKKGFKDTFFLLFTPEGPILVDKKNEGVFNKNESPFQRDSGKREDLSWVDKTVIDWFKAPDNYGRLPVNRRELEMAFDDNAKDPFVIDYTIKHNDLLSTKIKQILPNSVVGSSIFKNIISLFENHGKKIGLGLLAAGLLAIGSYVAVKAYKYLTKGEDVEEVVVPEQIKLIPVYDPKLSPQLQSLPLKPIHTPVEPKSNEINISPQLQSLPQEDQKIFIQIPILQGNDLNMLSQILDRDAINGTDHSLYIKQKIDRLLNRKLYLSKDWESARY